MLVSLCILFYIFMIILPAPVTSFPTTVAPQTTDPTTLVPTTGTSKFYMCINTYSF